mmetsp:Transcript_88615/g.275306  ORF Transcript_88615/g.275306 Transcript_88615/m.275306 type:complete len:215 (+) Transcript_88615:220-864(+)
MVLDQQAPVVLTADVQDVPEALVDEHILAPLARPAADLVEVVRAPLPALGPGVHGVLGEDLDRPVEAVLAVVDVDAVRRLLRVLFQLLPQQRREEDAVRVYLDRPGVKREAVVADDLLPNGHENGSVQCRHEFASQHALQVAVHDACGDPRAHLNDLVAVDGGFVALEDAHLSTELHLQEPQLVALRLHEGVAEERAGRVVHAQGRGGREGCGR